MADNTTIAENEIELRGIHSSNADVFSVHPRYPHGRRQIFTNAIEITKANVATVISIPPSELIIPDKETPTLKMLLY